MRNSNRGQGYDTPWNLWLTPFPDFESLFSNWSLTLSLLRIAPSTVTYSLRYFFSLLPFRFHRLPCSLAIQPVWRKSPDYVWILQKKANNARNERETKKDRRYEEKIQRSNRKRRRKTICSIERRARYVEILRIDYSAWNVGSQPSGLRVYVSKYFHARGKQWCGDTFLDRKFDKCVAPRNWLLSYPLVRGGY